MAIRALVINLEKRTDRLSFQQSQLDRLGIPWEKISAVDASEISADEYNARKYHWERCLRRPEVGCFLSHRLAWQRIARQQTPGLVLEDDAVLSEHLTCVLKEFRFTAGPACYNLEAGFAKKTISKVTVAPDVCGHRVYQIFYDRGGSGAYVMTPQAAEIALREAERRTAPADAFLNWLPGVIRYQFEPTLSLQLLYCRFSGDSETQAAAASDVLQQKSRLNTRDTIVYQPRLRARRLKSNIAQTIIKLRVFGSSHTRKIQFCPTIDTNR